MSEREKEKKRKREKKREKESAILGAQLILIGSSISVSLNWHHFSVVSVHSLDKSLNRVEAHEFMIGLFHPTVDLIDSTVSFHFRVLLDSFCAAFQKVCYHFGLILSPFPNWQTGT